jgi:hypothetical protein
MMARAHPTFALRPYLPQDAAMLAEIFRASIEELTEDDYTPPQQEARLHKLLDLNSEGNIEAKQRRELDALMEVYHDALLRKAMGLAEAVRRKLRPPISS